MSSQRRKKKPKQGENELITWTRREYPEEELPKDDRYLAYKRKQHNFVESILRRWYNSQLSYVHKRDFLVVEIPSEIPFTCQFIYRLIMTLRKNPSSNYYYNIPFKMKQQMSNGSVCLTMCPDTWHEMWGLFVYFGKRMADNRLVTSIRPEVDDYYYKLFPLEDQHPDVKLRPQQRFVQMVYDDDDDDD